MSDTASFVDPVFLARFGLDREKALDYFLHLLNPFRTKATTSNEVLAMQGTDIGTLRAYGTGGRMMPMTLQSAEDEYKNALSRLTGEQYELLPPPGDDYDLPSPLFVIRHVLRTNPTTVKVLGMYYILEGVIYKSPSVRSLMKANVTRTVEGLSEACDALSVCARYEPCTGYTWDFEAKDQDDAEDDAESSILGKRRKRMRRILDNRPPGERTDEEEEGIRASEAIDRILVRLSKSQVVANGKTIPTS
eukprot:CAMPEP_0195514518 /NCGR_PEP_ID=MMETSP0794_2-20130614/5877_1 /TAXON_ID=515487 /ORGANISM="Stephanopyxis turris, Strain CCMP 815" /LENGTH=247 /DNA_ID=CAMNT_0040642773 /DNA_START=96 /DNA_END=839 /DNA_ORIENTATION=+